ncbi:uncharacterized protein LOC119497554 isoform X2 [Sebastes umbrosus]|uniref:uncharacterized protein LOC119497554 isoform X2 n=1 Tax=Sebastes umbrosus TaxID=72105 RepID=UPI00189F70CA|nr:uncharacterized protein LOC119497554 isoform X2 [Sebastes umbrosus]
MLKVHKQTCAVVGCKNQHRSLHLPPQDTKFKWIHFIYDGNVPLNVTSRPYVCANHFTWNCYTNAGQYKTGFANTLRLKEGAVPTIRDPTTNPEAQASTSLHINTKKDAACQTDTTPTRHVRTQLSSRTLGPYYRSTGVQATVPCKDSGVGPSKRPRLEMEMEEEEEEEMEEEDEELFEGSSSKVDSEKQDPTYDPAESDTDLTESTDMPEAPSPDHKIKKFIVYESCIMELFEVCPVCVRACDVQTRRIGTFISVEQLCPYCQYSRQWNSQPILGSTPAGNLQLSAAVYLSGASFFKVEKIFKAMELQMFQYDTFRRHTRMFIEPAVVNKWKTSQDVTVQRLSEEDKVVVGGDMKAVSPGRSAKFGCYTMMDLKTNMVVDIQLVHSNEVGAGYHREKEGMKRSLTLLEERGVTLDSIVIKRHPKIQKFLRESNITHYCDISHMEKGISKQLEEIAKMKDCEKLQKWLPSIKKHIYWTAASSTTGPERVAKWTSHLNHVLDIHTHEDPIYPQCLHPLRKTTDPNKWLAAGTLAFYKLEKVMTNKKILKDVANLSPHPQTSSLEAFHRAIPRFAPKSVRFPFVGLLCRLYLAALYYNENADKEAEGTEKPAKTFRYVDDLMDLIFDKVFVDPTPYLNEVLKIPIPEDNEEDIGVPVQ